MVHKSKEEKKDIKVKGEIGKKSEVGGSRGKWM